MLLLLFATTGTSQASSFDDGPGTPWHNLKAGPPHSTPVGEIPRRAMAGFCASPNIVIGHIGTVQSHHLPNSTKSWPRIGSDTTFVVEKVLQDMYPVPKTLHLYLQGGTVKDVWSSSSPGAIAPVKGLRYVIGYVPRAKEKGKLKEGDPAVLAQLFVDPEAVITGDYQAMFAQMKEDYCE